MHRASLPVRIIALIGAVALFILAGGGALAVADDYLAREVLPEGAAVAGVDVAGLTRAEARERVQAEVAEPLSEPVTVLHKDATFTLDAGSMISVDVEGMVEAAFAPKAASSLPIRVADRVLARPSGTDVDVSLTLDDAQIAAWLDAVAASVDTTPSDATMTVEAGKMVVVASRTGETVDRTETTALLEEALTAGRKSVERAVTYTEPTVVESDLGPAILVDISERHLYLYDRGALVKDYGVAVGTSGHPTPTGDFRITLKRYIPTSSNPGSAWAADMPATIGPGVSNPEGTRALNLDAPGIRIHGTPKDGSIGTAASHGCMRMHRKDIEDLYERVEVGTPVFIVR
jgi:lipoprotein-anchoring transpeptidase ErfK/SrfK